MSKQLLYITLILTCFLAIGCTAIKESPKHKFTNGVYKMRSKEERKRVFIKVDDDGVQVFNYSKEKGIDTSANTAINWKEGGNSTNEYKYSFNKMSFDITLLAVPVKFRPPSEDFPPQINAGVFNGTVYLGKRIDVYRIKREKEELDIYKSALNHYGFSFGAFTGLGSTPMNEFVTKGRVNIEYDGVVWPYGLAGLFAVNNVSFGLLVGIDQLLDKNKHYWIYQKKPWVGIAVGFSLN